MQHGMATSRADFPSNDQFEKRALANYETNDECILTGLLSETRLSTTTQLYGREESS
jgi:hypothetical protein